MAARRPARRRASPRAELARVVDGPPPPPLPGLQLQYWQALGPDPQGVPAYQALSKKCSGLKAVTTLNKYSAMYLNNGVAVDFAHCNPADNTQAATNAAHQCCTATANALYSKVGKCKPAVVPVGYTAPGKSKA